MDALLWAAKTVGGPGSLGFLVAGLAAGITGARIFSRSRLPRIWIVLLAVYYIICSIPAVAQSAVAKLPQVQGVGHVPPDCPLDTLIVLGGDNFNGRIREAVRITSLCAPQHVLVSDEPWFARRLVQAGIPQSRVAIDPNSRTTLQQMQMVEEYVQGKPPRSVAVLASTLQIPRIAALARRAGMDVILLESPLDDERMPGPVRRLLPSFSALHVTYDAFYEHLALAYYRQQGWIH